MVMAPRAERPSGSDRSEPNHELPLICTSCGTTNVVGVLARNACDCGLSFPLRSRLVDLIGSMKDDDATTSHYTMQWGEEIDFFNFLEKNPLAKKIMPSFTLGWEELFESLRDAGTSDIDETWILDAGCGFGACAHELLGRGPVPGLRYVGADIHRSLELLVEHVPALGEQGWLLRWDISEPVPVAIEFDVVFCRASIHHTPDPPKTFRSLARRVREGGLLAISVYRKKAPAREALDDLFRNLIGRLPPEQALEACRQFTLLGKYLSAVREPAEVEEDLPLFGIERGTHDVQRLFYNHFLKCWYNPEFGDRYSDVVNFDWYHPPYAFRFEAEELDGWYRSVGFDVVHRSSNEAQHYLLGRRA